MEMTSSKENFTPEFRSTFQTSLDQDGFLISFPIDLLEKIKSRLEMFVIMSDVVIDDLSDKNFYCDILLNQNFGAQEKYYQ